MGFDTASGAIAYAATHQLHTRQLPAPLSAVQSTIANLDTYRSDRVAGGEFALMDIYVRAATAYSDTLLTLWDRIKPRLLADKISGRTLHPMWP